MCGPSGGKRPVFAERRREERRDEVAIYGTVVDMTVHCNQGSAAAVLDDLDCPSDELGGGLHGGGLNIGSGPIGHWRPEYGLARNPSSQHVTNVNSPIEYSKTWHRCLLCHAFATSLTATRREMVPSYPGTTLVDPRWRFAIVRGPCSARSPVLYRTLSTDD